MPDSRTALILIRNERSRAVCSFLLRHCGFRVDEVQTAEQVVGYAQEQHAELIVAHVTNRERATLQQELLDHLPNTRCLFIQERQTLDILDQTLRVSLGAPADSSSQN